MQVLPERVYEGDYMEVKPLRHHSSGKFPSQMAHERLRAMPPSASDGQGKRTCGSGMGGQAALVFTELQTGLFLRSQ